MELTNKDVETLVQGLRNVPINKDREQRELPMLPSIRTKRMLSDLDSFYESITEVREANTEKLDELEEELEERVKDEDDDYTADDMREEFNETSEMLGEEFEEMMEETVDVEFTDPLTKEDIDRIDQSDNNFPWITTLAMEILLMQETDD